MVYIQQNKGDMLHTVFKAIDDSDDVAAFDYYRLYSHHATQKSLHKPFARTRALTHTIMDLRQKFASTTNEVPSDYQNQ